MRSTSIAKVPGNAKADICTGAWGSEVNLELSSPLANLDVVEQQLLFNEEEFKEMDIVRYSSCSMLFENPELSPKALPHAGVLRLDKCSFKERSG